jgi:cytochrome c-type biogenesis protein CcmF
VIALGAGIITALTVTRVGWVVLAVALGTWVAAAVVGLLVEQARTREAKTGRPFVTEMRTVIRNDQPFWAGQLSHIGVALVAVGIAFAANLPLHAEVDLQPGQSAQFAGFDLVYQSPFRRTEPNRIVEGARVGVYIDDRLQETLEPSVNFYGDSAGIVTPAVMTRAEGDLYLTLRSIDSDSVSLALDTSPMVWLLWLGGITVAAGGFWSLAARRAVRSAAREREQAIV